MKERSVIFGSVSRLVGVTAEPVRVRPEGTAVVFLNAGLVHHVGPSRVYVRLARSLAAAGCLTLRFDLSGLGDSEPRSDGRSFHEAAVGEAREAMDFLARTYRVRQFVLAGICSGAGLAFNTAIADPRVAGVVLIDSYAYPTAGYRWRVLLDRIGRRPFQPVVWRNTWRGVNRPGRLLCRLTGRTPRPRPAVDEANAIWAAERPMPREEVAGVLRDLLTRGLEMCCVFTGGQTFLNYRRQIHDAFPEVAFGRQLTVHYLPEAAHTFPRQRHQQRLTDAIRAWVESTFAAELAVTLPAQARLHDVVID